MSKEYIVGRIDDIPDKGSVAVKAGRQTIAVFRDGEFEPANGIVRCPLHLWGWHLERGELETDPRQQIRTYPVKVVDGEVVLSA